MGTSRLSREARINIQQIIVILTMLLSDAGHADRFQAYNCRDIKGAVKAHLLHMKNFFILFFYYCFCVGRVPDPTSHFLPTSFCM